MEIERLHHFLHLSSNSCNDNLTVEEWKKLRTKGDEITDEIEHEQRMTPGRQRTVEICEYIKNHCWEKSREKEGHAAQFCQEAVEGKCDQEHNGIKRIEEKYAGMHGEIEADRDFEEGLKRFHEFVSGVSVKEFIERARPKDSDDKREKIAAMEKLGKLCKKYDSVRICIDNDDNFRIFLSTVERELEPFVGKTLPEAILAIKE